ncbi:SGNH/GDSL hydrolase family protein [Plantactinospora siamensis]|uniref:SGNH/GDSL hydrolase family protein n=1 Tax=Plantactinospora siamensis TaxID=555372 RepID=A0ABV6P4K7_9ACTN
MAAARGVALGLAVLLGCTSWGPDVLPAHGRPAAVPGRPAGPVVVALGDSVPAGTACGCLPFPDLYARRISAEARSVNLAHPGYTSADVRDQVRAPAVEDSVRSATVIMVMVGANDLAGVFDRGGDPDYRAAADGVEVNVAAALDRLRFLAGPSVPILVLGYWNVVEDGAVARADYGDRTAEADLITGYANDALRVAADAHAARYVPTRSAFRGHDGNADPTELLADDGDHPNARGHRAIAEAVYSAEPGPR